MWLVACDRSFATIREKLAYSDVPQHLRGTGISFITTGLMAMAFMGLTGIDISKPTTSKPAFVTNIATDSPQPNTHSSSEEPKAS